MAELNQSSRREFVEQLAEEFLERFRTGERPSWHEYAAKYPDHAELIGELFPTLIAVEGLAENSELEGDTTQDQYEPELSGAQIGPYKLLQQIGAGGMGVVYMAEQKEPIKRRVALKIIKPGMDSRQIVARFEAERQALAMMDHPNIARILDVGTTNVDRSLREREVEDEKGTGPICRDGPEGAAHKLDPSPFHRGPSRQKTPDPFFVGRPYFVMELVMGVPITKYCNERRLTPRERLELLVPICQAVQHAHQKGIIHRDLKPSNILVAEYDLKPVPKIIDFGLAKALHQQLTEKTLFTQFGQLVGTWEYMSPEQARLNQLDVDTRSDIYSLGVLLYELLTGHTPFDLRSLRSAAFDEILRIIRDEDPPRPSAKLSASGTLPSMAANCGTEPKKLMTLVRSDLDVIVMKALEKDRGRRYATATAFADDVERFLNYEPVLARRPSPAYRIRKFVRRNGAGVAVAVVLLASLIAGVIGTTIQWRRAVVAERSERTAREDAEATAEENVNLAAKETAARRQLQQHLRISKATQLAAQSAAVRDQKPIQSLVVALRAVETTRNHDGVLLPQAHEALLNANATIGGRPFPGYHAGIAAFATSANSRWMVMVAHDGVARVFDLFAPAFDRPQHVVTGVPTDITSITIDRNARWLATGSIEGTVRIWNLAVDDPSSAVQELSGHTNRIHELMVSPDARWLITASWDRTARIWDLASQTHEIPERTLLSHAYRVAGLEITPDSRWLYTLCCENAVLQWDLGANNVSSHGRELPVKPFQDQMLLSPNGQFLAVVVDGENRVQLFEMSPNGQTHLEDSLPSPGGGAKPLAFSPDNRWLVVGHKHGHDPQPYLFDLAAKDRASSFVPLAGHKEYVSVITFSADGDWLVTGSADNTLQLWSLRSDNPGTNAIRFVGGHDSPLQGAAVTADGRSLITVSSDATRVWDLHRALPGTSASVFPGRQIALSPNARWLATIDNHDVGRLWELTGDGAVVRSFPFGTEGTLVTAVTIGPENRWMAFGDAEGKVTTWELRGDNPAATARELPGQGNPIGSLAITSNDGRLIATSNGAQLFRMWDLTSNASRSARLLPTDIDLRNHQLFTADDWVIVCPLIQQDSHSPLMWDVMASDPATSLQRLEGHQTLISAASQSASRRWLATGSFDHTVRLYDLQSAHPEASVKVIGKEDASSAVRALALSWDGQTVFVGRWKEALGDVVTGSYGAAELWRRGPSNASAFEPFLLPLGSATAAEISPDGRWLAVGSEEKHVHVWDLKAKDLVASHRVLRGHANDVVVIKFSADGRWLFTCDGSTTRMWDLNVDSLIERARRAAGRELTDEERSQYGLVDEPLGI